MRFFLALLSTNLRAAFALRTTFFMQAGLMALNNMIMFVFWWVLFERFEQIGGWRLADVALLHGIATTGFGFAVVFGGGVSTLSRKIDDGELDPMLAQPRSALVQVIAARSAADGFGDIASGVFFFVVSGYLGGGGWMLAVVCVAIAAVMFVATGLMIHSLAFWLGRLDGLADWLWQFVIMFSVYPPTLFDGIVRVLLFTLIPAGFVSHLPASLLQSFDPIRLLLALGGATAYALLAVHVFSRGLRRYSSGSRFGVRA